MIPLMPDESEFSVLTHTNTEEIIYNNNNKNKNKREEKLKIHFVHNSLSLQVVPLPKIW